jgi:hypothetical protein
MQLYSNQNIMSVEDNQIIDLTADLSDLETPTPGIASAKKRARPLSKSDLKPDRAEKKSKKLRLLGESFAVQGEEKHYRAVEFDDMLIEVSRALTFIFRWLTSGRFDDHLYLGVSR